jgi:pimeloyl-ACP methyl ester carboxylesterase
MTAAEAIPDLVLASDAPAGGAPDAIDVLLVHGMGAGGWIWEGAAGTPFRDAGHRTWRVDLRTGAGATLGEYADVIARALARIDRPAIVVAHSLGAAALQLA